jgi:hypothetical protein
LRGGCGQRDSEGGEGKRRGRPAIANRHGAFLGEGKDTGNRKAPQAAYLEPVGLQ